ncbi:MAG: MATE family efflux transporter, partial [Spirochaetaceae bacterium]|nr:MATE family efflux transporter [Spirochaetaceae bacterium]
MYLRKYFGPWSFYREALSIAIPVMAQQFIMSMVSLIDNFMVAGLGDVSMAAVNVANQINTVYMVLINCICGAGGIFISQFMGTKDREGMGQAFRFKILFSCFFAALYFVLLWTIPSQLLGLMTIGNAARDEICEAGAGYMRLVSWTLFPIVLSTAIGGCFREIGKPVPPLIISACATGVNTLGNWILIYGNLGAPALGVEGAAIATIIARALEAFTYILYAKYGWQGGKSRTAPFFVGLRRILRVNWPLMKTITGRSAMMFFSDSSWIVSDTLMTALYNGRGGAETVAGMAAGLTIANITFLIWGGLFTVTNVLIGGS